MIKFRFNHALKTPEYMICAHDESIVTTDWSPIPLDESVLGEQVFFFICRMAGVKLPRS